MVEALKQFRSGGLLSYIVGEVGAPSSVVLDPTVGSMEEYRVHFAETRSKPSGILLTSRSEEFGSGLAQLRREQGLAEADPFDPGQVSPGGPELGRIPGAVPGEQAYSWKRCLFSGDQMRLGSSQRVPERFSILPDTIWVLPSVERNGLLFSTLGVERGRSGQEALEGSDRIPSIHISKFQTKVEQAQAGTLFVDVREPAEFLGGHIPGSVNFPMSELPLHWDKLRDAQRIYVCCLSGRRSQPTAQTLTYLGLADVVQVLGGFQSWQQSGYPVQK